MDLAESRDSGPRRLLESPESGMHPLRLKSRRRSMLPPQLLLLVLPASSKNLFPRWTSSGSAAAVLPLANGNRLRRERRKDGHRGRVVNEERDEDRKRKRLVEESERSREKDSESERGREPRGRRKSEGG
ncbi:hypothetical protein KM043_013436 [Ampulex compressa]|nr:hypothetical protein KM043_013436 [Ampulex compressa]